MTARRSPAQIRQDRNAIVRYVEANGSYVRLGSRVPWARPADVAALVKSGKLVKKVRREYDKSTGYQANMFGGAAVMVRHRAYYSLPEKDEA